MRNNLRLGYKDGDTWRISHFRLLEFETADGFALVDCSVVRSLERTREALGKQYGCEVRILITCGVRTVADNERLAAELGWLEDGGLVARDSRHLSKYGGLAVDIVAEYDLDGETTRVPQANVAVACRDHFSYVKANYTDGHVHADNRVS